MTTEAHSNPGPNGHPPELAVLLVTDGLQTIRKVLAHLRAQTVSDRIQMVVAAPPGSDVVADAPDFAGFADVRLVEAEVSSIRHARMATLSAATARIVVVAETHAFPDPEYAEKLLEAHQGPWAAVGPEVDNANPDTLLSWVELFMNYGSWFEPQRGVAPDVPGHNSAYKRSALLELGDRLERVFGHGTSLHPQLRSSGYELYVEPAARVRHLNPSVWRTYFGLAFESGRLYGVLRGADFSWIRRLVYIGGSPLIPAVRMARILRCAWRSPRGRALLPGLALALPPMLVANAIGAALGYVTRTARTERLDDAEMHRTHYLRPAERAREEDESTWPGAETRAIAGSTAAGPASA
jgi:hypothetical protein